MSLLVASCMGWGLHHRAFCSDLEYEPVPRGFADRSSCWPWAWRLIRDGLGRRRVRNRISYHPPYALLCCFWTDDCFPARTRGACEACFIVASMGITWMISRFQMGASEAQPFFSGVDDELAKLLQLRGSYNWVSYGARHGSGTLNSSAWSR